MEKRTDGAASIVVLSNSVRKLWPENLESEDMTEWKKEWNLHPRWKEANRACEHATGEGLYDAWYNTSGCYNDGHWVSPEVIAEAIAALMFGYEGVEVTA